MEYRDAYLNDKTIKKPSDVVTIKVMLVVTLGERGSCDWEETHGGTSGMAGKVLFLALDTGFHLQ